MYSEILIKLSFYGAQFLFSYLQYYPFTNCSPVILHADILLELLLEFNFWENINIMLHRDISFENRTAILNIVRDISFDKLF